MTKPMPLSAFTRLPPIARATMPAGLSAAIDQVAARAPASHCFLRFGWFAAALKAYGGDARTLMVEEDGRPVLALPLVATGPAVFRLWSLPGSYWPFRSFPVATYAGPAAFDAALDLLAREARAIRIGPVYDGDASAEPLLEAARARGWATLSRFVADSWLLDMGAAQEAGDWPRGSTLRKNRWHEKQLAQVRAPDW